MKINKADQIFSKYKRLSDNYTCQRCHKSYTEDNCRGLHNSHFYGRRIESTRYEPDNCTSLCFGCHQYFDETNREAYRDFKLNQLGEKRFNLLKIQANTYKKKDRKMEYIIWSKAYEELYE